MPRSAGSWRLPKRLDKLGCFGCEAPSVFLALDSEAAPSEEGLESGKADGSDNPLGKLRNRLGVLDCCGEKQGTVGVGEGSL